MNIEINTSFTRNSDTSLTWKALEYTDNEGVYHEGINNHITGLPCTVNIYQGRDGYELSNEFGEIYLPELNSTELLSILEYMAQAEKVLSLYSKYLPK